MDPRTSREDGPDKPWPTSEGPCRDFSERPNFESFPRLRPKPQKNGSCSVRTRGYPSNPEPIFSAAKDKFPVGPAASRAAKKRPHNFSPGPCSHPPKQQQKKVLFSPNVHPSERSRSVVRHFVTSSPLSPLSISLRCIPHHTYTMASAKVDAVVEKAKANAPGQLSGLALYSRFALAGAVCCSVTHGALTPVDV